MRPYQFHSQMHGIQLSPWVGSGAWWRSPVGGFWGAMLVTIPVSLLASFVDWLWWHATRT